MRSKRQVETEAKPSKIKKQRRLDEPEQGAFVFAHKIDIIYKYLVGTPRRPFHQPRKYFILLVTNRSSLVDFIFIFFFSLIFRLIKWKKGGKKPVHLF